MVSTPHRFSSLKSLSATVLVLSLLGFGLIGCQASDDVRQGGEGEYCNDLDNDCRSGLVCQNYVCVAQDHECDDICERLEECETPLENCVGRCLNTTDGWGPDALASFEACFIDDLSCSELRAAGESATQTCYNEIPVAEDRASVCGDFRTGARDCGADQDGVEALAEECRASARTLHDDDWADIEACDEHIEGACQDLFGCLNDELDLAPSLQ